MNKITLFSILLLSLFLLGNSMRHADETWLQEDTPVAEVLEMLGDEPAPHLPNTGLEGVSVERGMDIVLKGRTDHPSGGRSERVSKHFVCTSCHNIERDEPDLRKSDPEARLMYVNEKGLPFLQGSALYGVVDRRTFYNDDYEKKYGDLVKPARNDLREAIQLCATECAQGRYLEDWELESILAYLWTIGLKLKDLGLSADELNRINRSATAGEKSPAQVKLVKSAYLQGMPATFIDPPSDRKQGFSRIGDPEKGKLIYELSCLHCHENERYSFFNMDDSRLTFEFLERHIPQYTRYSIYQVARYGTSPIPGKRAYMPHYTREKMSEQMLEDLRVYIEQRAK